MGRPRKHPYVPKPQKYCQRCNVPTDRQGPVDGTYCLPCANIVSELSKAATRAVIRQIKLGVIPKAKALVCVDCEKPAHDYDHRDYDKPLQVVPVCRSCNIRRGPAIQGKRTAAITSRAATPQAKTAEASTAGAS